MTLISENVLIDTIYALGPMICFHYGLTAFACVWYSRRDLRRGGLPRPVEVPLRLLCPCLLERVQAPVEERRAGAGGPGTLSAWVLSGSIEVAGSGATR